MAAAAEEAASPAGCATAAALAVEAAAREAARAAAPRGSAVLVAGPCCRSPPPAPQPLLPGLLQAAGRTCRAGDADCLCLQQQQRGCSVGAEDRDIAAALLTSLCYDRRASNVSHVVQMQVTGWEERRSSQETRGESVVLLSIYARQSSRLEQLPTLVTIAQLGGRKLDVSIARSWAPLHSLFPGAVSQRWYSPGIGRHHDAAGRSSTQLPVAARQHQRCPSSTTASCSPEAAPT